MGVVAATSSFGQSATFGSVVGMLDEDVIQRAGQGLVDAAGKHARVILFGSAARGDETDGSDLDFLVIEREVDDRVAEATRGSRMADAVGRRLSL